AAEWIFVLAAYKTPTYMGDALPGTKLPAFTAKLADGQKFSNKDLQKGNRSILIFFRGRWSRECMIELQELEKKHEEFAAKNVQLLVISNESEDIAQETQARFPHLIVVSDTDQRIGKKMAVMDLGEGPNGKDVFVPTTFFVDGDGFVRWVNRPRR